MVDYFQPCMLVGDFMIYMYFTRLEVVNNTSHFYFSISDEYFCRVCELSIISFYTIIILWHCTLNKMYIHKHPQSKVIKSTPDKMIPLCGKMLTIMLPLNSFLPVHWSTVRTYPKPWSRLDIDILLIWMLFNFCWWQGIIWFVYDRTPQNHTYKVLYF